MYTGSTLCFLGTALWCAPPRSLSRLLLPLTPKRANRYEAPAGVALTALVYVVYQIALAYEECVPLLPPFRT